MKNLMLRFCRWALALLGISAFDSCAVMYGSPIPDDIFAMYGTPTMEYRVSGKVADSRTGEPIEGIQVGYRNLSNGPQTTLTTDNGEFVVEGNGYPSENIKLQFEDIDEEHNGWYFPKEIEVDLVKAENGDGAWFTGIYVADGVLVKLEADQPAEYGVPIVEFSVRGRVVDSESAPIENIEVTAANHYESVRTAADGSFHLTGEMTGFELNELTLRFVDTDGQDNGGEFEERIHTVQMIQTGPGDGKWDNGDYNAEYLEITLRKK